MTRLSDIEARLSQERLAIFGGFHPEPEDHAPAGCRTLLLIGPKEPGFWAHVTAAPEFLDGATDPIDRWSRRVIGTLACELGAKALFPFGGPPYRPFIAWAARSGRCWPSPVTLLVHDTAGMMVSYRGALALQERLDLPDGNRTPPCEGCHSPCVTACPVNALTPDGYDTAACHAHLDTPEGQDCLSQGCRARRACPISQSYGRLPAQSAYHMGRFHPRTG